MHLKTVYLASGGMLIAVLSGEPDRVERLNAYNRLAAHVIAEGCRRLIIDKSRVDPTDHLDLDLHEWGHDEIALWLDEAGVTEAVFIAGETDAMTNMLATALRRRGIAVAFAEERSQASLPRWSPPVERRA